MLCLAVIWALVGVVSTTSVMVPINLTLCEERTDNVSKFLTDVYVVQPEDDSSCELTNSSAPVVRQTVHGFIVAYLCLQRQTLFVCLCLSVCLQLFHVVSHAPQSDISAPVVFVARSERNVQTWQIPLKLPQ